jgi:glutamine phosphoribosylpyrophosphate amidotransferase
MCGINGYLSSKGDYTVDDIFTMNASMPHRGPDAQGEYHDELVGLGHLRLSILDLSESANQPLHSQSNRYVIAFNGEVYNFQEVRKEIKTAKPGFHFRTSSDTEVLIEAFELWGVEMIQKFKELGVNLIITTDHGTVKVNKPIKIIGERNTNSNLRYKVGRGLSYNAKEVFVVNKPNEAFLPQVK